MFKGLSLKAQLISGFLIMVLVAAVTGVSGMYAMKKVDHSAIVLNKELTPQGKLITDVILFTNEAYLALVKVFSEMQNASVELAWATLDMARIQNQAILNGSEEDGIQANNNPETRAKIENLDAMITAFETKARESLKEAGEVRAQRSAAEYLHTYKYSLLMDEIAIAKDTVPTTDAVPGSFLEQLTTAEELITSAYTEMSDLLMGQDSVSIEGIQAKLEIASGKLQGEYFREISAEQLAGLSKEFSEASMARYTATTDVSKRLADIDLALYTAYVNVSVAAMDAKGIIQTDVEEGISVLEKTISTSYFVMGATVAIGLVMAALLSGLILRAVIKPLNQCVDVASTIAKGDLRVAVSGGGNNETGRLLNAMGVMSDNLRSMVTRVKSTTNSLVDGNRSLSSASSAIAGSTSVQAENLGNIARFVEENTGNIRSTADNAAEVSKMAITARNQALEGNEWMHRMQASVNGISESSEQISHIIGTIDEIAFQTNLLALNAAVEAARAGEQGRGFAVVATEVRNLAQRSAEAANETKQLINESMEKARSGVEVATKTADSLNAIVDSTGKVTQYVEEIASSSEQQRKAMDEINQGLSELSDLTQKNANIAEESAQSSQELFQLTSDLENIVGAFHVEGRSATSVSNSKHKKTSRFEKKPKQGVLKSRNTMSERAPEPEF